MDSRGRQNGKAGFSNRVMSIILLAAVQVAVIPLVFGVRLAGDNHAPDGVFVVSALNYFDAAMLSGDFPPRWAAGVARLVFRIGSLATCAFWLGRHVDRNTALVGGALYALTPYNSIIDPQARLAFVETAGFGGELTASLTCRHP